MNNLAIAVIAIAVSQALTIFIVVRRDREIKKLRELVNEQRLHIDKLRGLLAGTLLSHEPNLNANQYVSQ